MGKNQQAPRPRTTTCARTGPAKLAQGHTLYGIAIEYGNVQTVEIAAAAGCDFAIFDQEHEAVNLADTVNLVRAANISGITPIARLGRNYGHYIDPLLAAGVQGFILSRIKSAADITALTDMIYYHPLGKRTAWAHGRTAQFGIGTDFDAWCAQYNKELHVHVIIEEQKAIENIDEILAHPLLDVVEVGPNDLRLSMGLPSREEVARIEEETFAKAVNAGKYILEVHNTNTLTPRAWKEIRPGHGSLIAGAASTILSKTILANVAEVHERSKPRN